MVANLTEKKSVQSACRLEWIACHLVNGHLIRSPCKCGNYYEVTYKSCTTMKQTDYCPPLANFALFA